LPFSLVVEALYDFFYRLAELRCNYYPFEDGCSMTASKLEARQCICIIDAENTCCA
jgi:hypothetical protein